MINAIRFHRNLRKEEIIAFNINLYKINHLIKKKQLLIIINNNKINKQFIIYLLLKEYKDL